MPIGATAPAELLLDAAHQIDDRGDRGAVVADRSGDAPAKRERSVMAQRGGFDLAAAEIDPDPQPRRRPEQMPSEPLSYYGFFNIDRIREVHIATALFLHRRMMMREDSATSEQGDRQRRYRVLIVEDNDLNMKLFNDLLLAQGYDTLQTKNGVEAIELARRHRPHLILMDIQLPEVSGLDITRWIKDDESLRMIPIIAVTAFAMKGDEEKMREGGCEAYIAKPISVASFLRTVEQFLFQGSPASLRTST
jgi:two-component system cell cycle response regulator DivK